MVPQDPQSPCRGTFGTSLVFQPLLSYRSRFLSLGMQRLNLIASIQRLQEGHHHCGFTVPRVASATATVHFLVLVPSRGLHISCMLKGRGQACPWHGLTRHTEASGGS